MSKSYCTTRAKHWWRRNEAFEWLCKHTKPKKALALLLFVQVKWWLASHVWTSSSLNIHSRDFLLSAKSDAWVLPLVEQKEDDAIPSEMVASEMEPGSILLFVFPCCDCSVKGFAPTRSIFKGPKQIVHGDCNVTIITFQMSVVEHMIVRPSAGDVKSIVTNLCPNDEVQFGVQVNPWMTTGSKQQGNQCSWHVSNRLWREHGNARKGCRIVALVVMGMHPTIQKGSHVAVH